MYIRALPALHPDRDDVEAELERVLAVTSANFAAERLRLPFAGYEKFDSSAEILIDLPHYAVGIIHWKKQDPAIAVMVRNRGAYGSADGV